MTCMPVSKYEFLPEHPMRTKLWAPTKDRLKRWIYVHESKKVTKASAVCLGPPATPLGPAGTARAMEYFPRMSPASVLITGANRGVGLELVRQFAQLQPNCPKHVFAGCRSPESAKDLQDLQTKCKNISIVKIDLNDEDSFTTAAKDVENAVGDAGLNLLINNAGVGARSGVDAVSSQEMVDLYKINAVGPMMVTKAFLPLLRKAASGSDGAMSSDKACVVNISTGVASITDNDTGGAYAYRASKAALNMITKNLSLDLKKDGILVSAIHPGWIKTDMGGPNAKTDVSDCGVALLKVIDSLKSEDKTGKFYHFTGKEMPW